MKYLFILLLAFSALFASVVSLAHAPVCRCELNNQQVNCEGGYHDGRGAVDFTMVVFAYDGATLASGKLDNMSRFNFPLPSQPFYILMDVGPGEMFEVDWRDVYGVDGNLF